ncbi:unnamed protein product [Onchocerca flexuosa]|uniref:Transposase n=1 Tax=Onchocerca flexuosa TaxID=387005 RepID=A0A183I0N3_9BILA|nr:unnamed protein product [Onchocerca flexuosa]
MRGIYSQVGISFVRDIELVGFTKMVVVEDEDTEIYGEEMEDRIIVKQLFRKE